MNRVIQITQTSYFDLIKEHWRVSTARKTIPINKVTENRAADIRLYVTDNSKVTALTGWTPSISMKQIVTEITAWLTEYESQLAYVLK